MSENSVVTWSAKYLLKWSDFHAESNPATFGDSCSTIKYRHTWTVNYDDVESQIMFFVENLQIYAEFQPLLSWTRTQSDLLLKHEQGRFDLAELTRRENLERLRGMFYKKRFPVQGKNDEQQKQFAKEVSGRMIAVEIENLENIFLQRSRKYDEETGYGQDVDRQSRYDWLFEGLKDKRLG